MMMTALMAVTTGTVCAEQPAHALGEGSLRTDTPTQMAGKKEKKFEYSNERFADLQMLRYKVASTTCASARCWRMCM